MKQVMPIFLACLLAFLGTSCISTDSERERVERDVNRRTKQILDYGGTIKTEKEARQRAKSEVWEKDFFRKMRSRN
ncbi:MAG: hypothetical protein HOK49_11665 [Opitutae bacterium]|nr:hypothetical protein [Opitutae bacterium]MBT6463182.1 hypothetical protein [Opitutae bacterium]